MNELINEIIQIEINLSSIVKSELFHRKFIYFIPDIETIELNKNNYKELIKEFNKTEQDRITTWFVNGGISLILSSDLSDISGKNILLTGTLQEQTNIYNSLDSTIQSTKNFYFSTMGDDNINNLPIGRNIRTMLVDNDVNMFAYYAAYTNERYYRKNNFESSKLQGLKLKTLQYLVDNTLGANVYFSSLRQSRYYNIVDMSGFGVNLDFLVDDLEYEIKNVMLKIFVNHSIYDQSLISKLENVSSMVCDEFIKLDLINTYSLDFPPYELQTPQDIQQGIIRNLKISYDVKTEAKTIKLTISETI